MRRTRSQVTRVTELLSTERIPQVKNSLIGNLIVRIGVSLRVRIRIPVRLRRRVTLRVGYSYGWS
jgi:hypothetical protein